MRRLWNWLIGVFEGLLAVCFGLLSAAMLVVPQTPQGSEPDYSRKVAAYAFSVLALVWLFLSFRRLRRRKGNRTDRQVDEVTLERWRRAESRPIKRPRDPRTKFCLENLGKEIPIRYRGKDLRITPIRVYSKPTYRRTYVDALSQGEQRTYNIDEMEIS